MSEIEIITDGGRRRRWPAAEKLRIVEETLYDGESISAFARRNGLAPNLLYRWRNWISPGLMDIFSQMKHLFAYRSAPESAQEMSVATGTIPSGLRPGEAEK